MGKRVVIYGASGMVGKGVLLECLDHQAIDAVVVVGRKSCGVQHPKLTQHLLQDLFEHGPIEAKLEGLDACFFCLGVSSAGMSEDQYTRVTYDLTLHVARLLLGRNQDMTFCYVSGEGTDSSEQGRSMWARVKGRTENALRQLGFGGCYLFRPAYIQPRRGVVSSTRSYRIMYGLMSPFFPIWKTILPGYTSTTEQVGQAMIAAALLGADQPILDSRAIKALAQQAGSPSCH